MKRLFVAWSIIFVVTGPPSAAFAQYILMRSQDGGMTYPDGQLTVGGCEYKFLDPSLIPPNGNPRDYWVYFQLSEPLDGIDADRIAVVDPALSGTAAGTNAFYYYPLLGYVTIGICHEFFDRRVGDYVAESILHVFAPDDVKFELIAQRVRNLKSLHHLLINILNIPSRLLVLHGYSAGTFGPLVAAGGRHQYLPWATEPFWTGHLVSLAAVAACEIDPWRWQRNSYEEVAVALLVVHGIEESSFCALFEPERGPADVYNDSQAARDRRFNGNDTYSEYWVVPGGHFVFAQFNGDMFRLFQRIAEWDRRIPPMD